MYETFRPLIIWLGVAELAWISWWLMRPDDVSPSPLRRYHGTPDASIVFEFPMVLAPNFTVPLFMLAHLFALVKLTAGG